LPASVIIYHALPHLIEFVQISFKCGNRSLRTNTVTPSAYKLQRSRACMAHHPKLEVKFYLFTTLRPTYF